MAKPLDYEISRSRKQHVSLEISKLSPVISKAFPELAGRTLRLVDKASSWHVASFDWRSKIIEMNFAYFEHDTENTLPFVLTHETVHAVQWMTGQIPHGEKSADVFALSRLPFTLYPRKRAFYIRVPRRLLFFRPKLVKETAEKAIDLRRHGVRRYIVWLEDELKRIEKHERITS